MTNKEISRGRRGGEGEEGEERKNRGKTFEERDREKMKRKIREKKNSGKKIFFPRSDQEKGRKKQKKQKKEVKMGFPNCHFHVRKKVFPGAVVCERACVFVLK